MNSLPPELISVIFESLSTDEFFTLNQCSLVCQQWLSLARTYTFRQLNLYCARYGKSEYAPRSIHSVRTFLQTESPHLIPYIQILRIQGVDSNIATYSHPVLTAAQLLPNLCGIEIHDFYLSLGVLAAFGQASIQRFWYRLFERRGGGREIVSVEFKRCFVPASSLDAILRNESCLERIVIHDSAIVPPDEDDERVTTPELVQPAQSQSPEHFSCSNISDLNLLFDWMLDPSSSISLSRIKSLEIFCIKVYGLREVASINKVLLAVSDSLQRLEIGVGDSNSSMLTSSNAWPSIDLSPLSHLSYLRFKDSFPPIWIKRILGTVNSSVSNCLSHIEIEVELDTRDADARHWKEIDDLLTRNQEGFAALRLLEIRFISNGGFNDTQVSAEEVGFMESNLPQTFPRGIARFSLL